MKTSTLTLLSDLIRENSDSIIRQWADRVTRMRTGKGIDTPRLIDHMPTLVEELASVLHSQEEMTIESTDSNDTSETHGTLRFKEGFDVVEVVAEYNVLREVLHEFADQQNVSLGGPLARLVNRKIDHAIAFAVKAYALEKTLELQRRREEHFSFVVHDLKTPLAAIETAISIINTKYKTPDELASRMLDLVQRNARRLHALICHTLQDGANLQTQFTRLEKREFDIWPLVENLIKDCAPLADAAKTHLINVVPEDLSINADAHAVCRIFQNLLSNAIKYTKGGQVIIGARKTSDGVELWVKDSGEGIAPEQLEKIFEKLETDHNGTDGGLGLGLAIVKDLVEGHGGEITVQSEVGKGSHFTISIPDDPKSGLSQAATPATRQ
jgi:two-component system, OmpR family, phosphate regulon sensor histidine kinase PhoR